MAQQPLTAQELVQRIWPGGLTPFHHHFAVFEILAHLEYLQRRGRVTPESRGSRALWWSCSKNPRG